MGKDGFFSFLSLLLLFLVVENKQRFTKLLFQYDVAEVAVTATVVELAVVIQRKRCKDAMMENMKICDCMENLFGFFDESVVVVVLYSTGTCVYRVEYSTENLSGLIHFRFPATQYHYQSLLPEYP